MRADRLIGAEIQLRQGDPGTVGTRGLQHITAIRREGQLEQRAGETGLAAR